MKHLRVYYNPDIFKHREEYNYLHYSSFKLGDKICFLGIRYYFQIWYYLKLDTKTIYTIENVEHNGYMSYIKFIGIEDIFDAWCFERATIKQIRKQKLNILNESSNL